MPRGMPGPCLGAAAAFWVVRRPLDQTEVFALEDALATPCLRSWGVAAGAAVDGAQRR